jgi:hypothetical protein
MDDEKKLFIKREGIIINILLLYYAFNVQVYNQEFKNEKKIKF